MTKLKGDIAEQALVLECLKRGWGVSIPVGDRLPYDIVIDIDGRMVRGQVKSAWFDSSSSNYIVETRRTKTNRRNMIRDYYEETDFEYAFLYIEDSNVWYIIPIHIFLSYSGAISLVEEMGRQRVPKSAEYREAWNQLLLPKGRAPD